MDRRASWPPPSSLVDIFKTFNSMPRVKLTGVCIFCKKLTSTKVIALADFDFDETPGDQSVKLGGVVACGDCWRKTLHETIVKAVSGAAAKMTDDDQLSVADKDIEQRIIDSVVEIFVREAK